MLPDRAKRSQFGEDKDLYFGLSYKNSDIWSPGKMGSEKDLDDPGMALSAEETDLIDLLNNFFLQPC